MEVESYHYDLNEDLKIKPIDEKPKLNQCIDDIIRKEGYKTCDVVKRAISTNGGNYLGVLYEIDVKGNTDNGEKETHIFVKSMASDAIDLKIISLDNVYNRELFYYTELNKIFNELQDEAQVPQEDRFNAVKSYDESYPEAIILENITRKGFKTWFRMDIITIDMAEVCVKQLARFHALSIVLKNKRPELFENMIETMKIPFIFGKDWENFSTHYREITLEKLDKDLKKKVGEKLSAVLEKYELYYQDDSSKYCLCHGDYRPNNVMVKEMDGKVTEALPVDYQLIHYGCPILDFLYFMYTGADHKFRRAHMLNLKDLYFESLARYLQWFDIPVETVLPKKVLEEMYNEKLDYGLMVTVFYVPFMFVDEGDVPELTKKDVTDIDIALDDRFRDRLAGTVEEFIELGYL